MWLYGLKVQRKHRACRRHRRDIVNTDARFTQSRIANKTRTSCGAMLRSPNLSETGYRDFFNSRRRFVKSLTRTALKVWCRWPYEIESFPVCLENLFWLSRRRDTKCSSSLGLRSKEGRNARGIARVSFFVFCITFVSLFLYSRYAADFRELCEMLWLKSYKMFFINVQIWQLLSLVLCSYYECTSY